MRNQQLFSGVDRFFKWTTSADGIWYEFDADAARKDALRRRNEMAKSLRSEGRKVSVFSLGQQLRSKGGIGSGRPQIEFYCTTYGLNAS